MDHHSRNSASLTVAADDQATTSVHRKASRRLAPLGGRRSERSVELRDTLLPLLRHAEATNTERDGEPAAR
jgi:hypothetical protein